MIKKAVAAAMTSEFDLQWFGLDAVFGISMALVAHSTLSLTPSAACELPWEHFGEVDRF